LPIGMMADVMFVMMAATMEMPSRLIEGLALFGGQHWQSVVCSMCGPFVDG
jgi:hypothetical protein